ncbi:hypothetical protein G6F59_018578 [Rhizopus arrhizus]|nr:hypothetical protein G6F59_018578 [Rhizopus arrhizus]
MRHRRRTRLLASGYSRPGPGHRRSGPGAPVRTFLAGGRGNAWRRRRRRAGPGVRAHGGRTPWRVRRSRERTGRRLGIHPAPARGARRGVTPAFTGRCARSPRVCRP